MTSKRTLATAVAVTTGAVAAAGAVLAGPATAGGSQTLDLTAHHISDSSIDVGAKGFSAGDYDVHKDRLVRSGTTIGWEVGNCLTIRVAKTADELCEMVLHLPHGQIVASGAVHAGPQGPKSFVLGITGGTGRYDDARGTLSLTPGSGDTIPVTVDVRY